QCSTTERLYNHLTVTLLFPSYVHQRYPHSFPTRRSSDLIRFSNEGQTFRSFEPLNYTEQEYVTYEVKNANNQGIVWNISDVNEIDRKSTRLNSSHVSISYAVFCLKKKKQCKECQHSTR